MDKTEALRLLGGSATSAAAAIGISPQAVSQWPAKLPAAIADRVQAAIARKHLPADMLGLDPKGALDAPTPTIGALSEQET